MKKVVLSALFALGLCFGLAAAPDANAPAGKSGKTSVQEVSAKAKGASRVKKAVKAKAAAAAQKTTEAEAPQK